MRLFATSGRFIPLVTGIRYPLYTFLDFPLLLLGYGNVNAVQEPKNHPELHFKPSIRISGRIQAQNALSFPSLCLDRGGCSFRRP